MINLLKLLLLFLFFTTSVQAQNNLTPSFKFKDGVYTSHKELLRNQPAFKLYDIPRFAFRLDEKENLFFLSDTALVGIKNSPIKALENIYTITLKGVPYLKMKTIDQAKNEQIYFVRFYLQGNISYFYYPKLVNQAVEMVVYSPINGQPIAKKKIMNTIQTYAEYIMQFEEGKVQPMTATLLRAWLNKDTGLSKSILNMTDEELKEKAFKLLKIYNERNPQTLKTTD